MNADYVIVGAGSAGCVVARRLADTGHKVVLLEAGPKDTHPYIHIPAGILKLLDHPKLNWNYHSEGEEGTAGARVETDRKGSDRCRVGHGGGGPENARGR